MEKMEEKREREENIYRGKKWAPPGLEPGPGLLKSSLGKKDRGKKRGEKKKRLSMGSNPD